MLIVGNWKSNKTILEAKEWVSKITIPSDISVVVCVPFTALSSMHQAPFSLGAQNVSAFPEGAYTGEITATMIKEVAEWVIIGHSERRKYFHETDEILAKKTEQARKVGLKIIFCVPDDEVHIPVGVDVVAYEPVWAIGTGKAETPENAQKVIASIKQKTGVSTVIYGGSVTPENIRALVNQASIDGVLAGGMSLDPIKFSQLLYEAKNHT